MSQILQKDNQSLQKNRKLWVYDIETLASCFTYTAYNVDTLQVVQYTIHEDKNELRDLISHLLDCLGQIGFNNLSFDYPIIHFILANYKAWFELQATEIIAMIYAKAQFIIQEQNESKFSLNKIKDRDMKIAQMDLFKIWHYDNRARSTSLKALEISMNYPNVMDMHIDHSRTDISINDVSAILEYNLNDVMATHMFYLKTLEMGKIDLRKAIIAKHGLPCLNWNNGKIGEELILKLYCDKLGLDKWEVKRMRTVRDKIDLKDCVPSLIKFESKEFNKLLDFFNTTTITETKGSIDKFIVFKGIKYVFGTGGVHAAIKSGVYESDNRYIIKSLDVASLYPNIPIVFEFYIEHLGKEFLYVYRDNIVNVRLAEKAKPKEDQDKAIVDGYKEAANIPYGKSNDVNSFLYDPLYSMKTTIAGQLAITMLCERLSQIPDSQMLMVNTDGCEIRIPVEMVDRYNAICKQWEIETKLVLEFADYSKMWIRDINNYGCVTTKGKVKNKGAFEVDKVIGNEPAYHKDNSFRIVPLAIEQFFVKGTPVEDTIRFNSDIYNFCGRQKFKGQDYGVTHSLDYRNNVAYDKIEHQQKNVRYYIASKGSSFIKHYSKGSVEVINKGYQVNIFNKYVQRDIKNYNINYDFYIKQAYREIDTIIDKQLELF